MPNTTTGFGPRNGLVPWNTYPSTILPYGTFPAGVSSIVVASGVAIGRDLSGNCQVMDDTQSLQFIGFTETLKKVTVTSTNTIQTPGITGDNNLDVRFPVMYTAQIAAAVAGQEGRKVYWQFNNQVTYSPGNFSNFAGTVWTVKDSTHVLVLSPWVSLGEGFIAWRTLASTGNIVLTKWDTNRAFGLLSTAPQVITLPLSTLVSPGDEMYFNQQGAGSFAVQFAPTTGDKIQGSTSNYTGFGTAQFSRTTFVTDGAGNWFLE